jgi:hypothetical protein
MNIAQKVGVEAQLGETRAGIQDSESFLIFGKAILAEAKGARLTREEQAASGLDVFVALRAPMMWA